MSYPAEGRRVKDWECLQCSRSWPQRRVLDMLRNDHVNCCNIERRRTLLIMAGKLMGVTVPLPILGDEDGSSGTQQR